MTRLVFVVRQIFTNRVYFLLFTKRILSEASEALCFSYWCIGITNSKK